MDINKAVKHLQDDIHEQIARYKADAEEINVNNAELHRKYAKVYGGELLADKLRSIDEESKESRNELYNVLNNECDGLIKSFNSKVKNYIALSVTDDLQIIESLSKLVTDMIEFDYLIKRYNGRSYWYDAALRNIAESKDFCNASINPSIEKVCEMVAELRQRIAECKGDLE